MTVVYVLVVIAVINLIVISITAVTVLEIMKPNRVVVVILPRQQIIGTISIMMAWAVVHWMNMRIVCPVQRTLIVNLSANQVYRVITGQIIMMTMMTIVLPTIMTVWECAMAVMKSPHTIRIMIVMDWEMICLKNSVPEMCLKAG